MGATCHCGTSTPGTIATTVPLKAHMTARRLLTMAESVHFDQLDTLNEVTNDDIPFVLPYDDFVIFMDFYIPNNLKFETKITSIIHEKLFDPLPLPDIVDLQALTRFMDRMSDTTYERLWSQIGNASAI